VQDLTIKVFALNRPHPIEDENRHTFLGEATFFLASLMTSDSLNLSLKVSKGRAQVLN
jgi:hypothetical protein